MGREDCVRNDTDGRISIERKAEEQSEMLSQPAPVHTKRLPSQSPGPANSSAHAGF